MNLQSKLQSWVPVHRIFNQSFLGFMAWFLFINIFGILNIHWASVMQLETTFIISVWIRCVDNFKIHCCRHEKPTDPDDPLADQNIKDRFYGSNDPVADKLLQRYTDMPKLTLPEDKTITTLYIGNLGEKIGEKELRWEFFHLIKMLRN